MLVEKTYFITSSKDPETKLKRKAKTEVKIVFDDSKTIKALVLIIPGYGSDISSNLYSALYVARNYDACAVLVNYFNISNRPQTGSSFCFDDFDNASLLKSLQELNIKPYFDKITNYEELNISFKYIDHMLALKKQNSQLSPYFVLKAHVSLQAKNDEYVNFLLSSVDLINAVLFVKQELKTLAKLSGGGF